LTQNTPSFITPPDRRHRLWIRSSILIGTGAAIAALVAAAWIEVAAAGLPRIPPVPVVYPNNFAGPHGFPLWVRYCHFFNFLFVTMLIRSGLSILADHPRLYFNDDCTPGSEWIRFTPIKVPRDRLWTARDDARYLTPLVGTPGYRHTIGVARVWHFINVHGFILCGVYFVAMVVGFGPTATEVAARRSTLPYRQLRRRQPPPPVGAA
jgi:sulfoxide reductase catalytic subunit YedY